MKFYHDFEANKKLVRSKEPEILESINQDYLCCPKHLNFEFKLDTDSEIHVHCDVQPTRRNDAATYVYGFRIAKFILPDGTVIEDL